MICQVCGDKTSFMHYGAMCCMSCKTFFRRQTKYDLPLRCRFNTNACEMNRTTRRNCPACRLAMCYRIGMRKCFIRSPEENARYREQIDLKHRQLIELKYKTAQIDTLDLLHADRSSLNIEQWSLISNLTHNFDIFYEEQTKQLLNLQKPNPFKTRFKLSLYDQYVTICFNTTKPFIERIPDYQQLTISNRLIIIQRTFPSLVAINAMNNMNLTGYRPYFDKNLQHIYDVYYGSENIFQSERLREKLYLIFNSDLTIFKLFLSILIFSNLTSDLTISIDNEYVYSQTIFHLQNRYIDIIWRYILFRFRHEHIAIKLFSNMIQYCIHMQNFIHNLKKKMESAQNVMDVFIKNVETSLKL